MRLAWTLAAALVWMAFVFFIVLAIALGDDQ